MKKQIIAICGSLLLFIAMAIAFSYVKITAPSEYYYSTSVGVNISGAINVSQFPYLMAKGESLNFSDNIVNVTILNKSSESGSYGILASSLSLTINATNRSPDIFWNFTATFRDKERHWIRLNFTNVSRDSTGDYGGYLSSERIVEIDTEYYTLNIGGFGMANITLDTGDIKIAGKLFAKNISLINNAGTRVTCGANASGVMWCS